MNGIVIDGRKFECVTQEPARDYVVENLRIAGALDIFRAAAEKPVDAKNAAALLTRLMVSGRAPQILAGCLAEAGKSWTVEEANRNAARFAAITKAEDKAAMRMAMAGFVIGFFQYALQSATISPKSSGLLN